MSIPNDAHSNGLKWDSMVSRSQASSSTYHSLDFMTVDLYLSAWSSTPRRCAWVVNGPWERRRGRTDQQRCDERVKSCGIAHLQYIHVQLLGHCHIPWTTHQMKNNDQFCPLIFHSWERHVDCQMSVCWESVMAWVPWQSWLLTTKDAISTTW